MQANFDRLAEVAAAHGFDRVDGILFDLGLSSYQLDEPERGFGIRAEGPLDMRLDPSTGDPAAMLLNRLPERELTRIIRELGEERWAARIAQFVVRRRPLQTTTQLAEAVEAAIPRAAWPKRIHPATRTFQALRIAVNDELGSLERALPQAAGLLDTGGRLAVISFHSLEDRIARRFITADPTLKKVNPRPLYPSAAETGRPCRSTSTRSPAPSSTSTTGISSSRTSW